MKKEITTPNYPRDYPGGKTCTWNLEVPTGYRIELRFIDFHLEGSSSSECRYDYLEIYNGRSTSSSKLGDKLCGASRPSNKVSSSNRLYLRWKSDGDTNHSGFKITVSSKCK